MVLSGQSIFSFFNLFLVCFLIPVVNNIPIISDIIAIIICLLKKQIKQVKKNTQEKVIQKMLSDDFSEFVFFKNRFVVAKRAIIALKKITA